MKMRSFIFKYSNYKLKRTNIKRNWKMVFINGKELDKGLNKILNN